MKRIVLLTLLLSAAGSAGLRAQWNGPALVTGAESGAPTGPITLADALAELIRPTAAHKGMKLKAWLLEQVRPGGRISLRVSGSRGVPALSCQR